MYGNVHVSNTVIIGDNAQIYDNVCASGHTHIIDDTIFFVIRSLSMTMQK